MDWKLLASTFVAVFLAELGDKTQIAVFTAASSLRKFREVFFGASAALILSTLIATFLGDTIGKYVPERPLKIASGIIFIALGIAILFSRQSQ